MLLIITAGVSAVVAGIVGFLIAKRLNSSNYTIYTDQAKAKAKAIEHEAEIALQTAKLDIKKLESQLEKEMDDRFYDMKRTYDKKHQKLEKKDKELGKRLNDELRLIEQDRKQTNLNKKVSDNLIVSLNKQKESYDHRSNELIQTLENNSGLTKREAKDLILKYVKEQSRDDIANIVRKAESEARNEAKRKADYILAQATTRFAGEFASERLINIVQLPSDELKGRIIGKEGRNIKTLEMLLGVDIIIDDTPNTIVISNFNLYRRAIATTTIEKLVEDGRIQPSRIEEIYKSVVEDYEEEILKDGEDVVLNLGIKPLHTELNRLIGKLRYRASYGQNALGHSLEVANLAGIIAGELGGDVKLAKRAGLLHDIGKALTQESSSSDHVALGAEICERFNEDDVVINAIYAHHGHKESTSVESAAVCTADALSAARPGARREVLESFLKRVEEIEEIAHNKYGVRQAYAINAGREIRVILNAELLNDAQSTLLAKEIAKEIEEKVQYPGEIKVNVIRELRAVNYAR